ncbi:hypothetical protein BGZ63DRAFT_389128 [Mariannaea sp. PMI_226]|nr:hypothetical protein BGZ63DRAFT_389128 [Mariannaea sp. PMI_226]
MLTDCSAAKQCRYQTTYIIHHTDSLTRIASRYPAIGMKSSRIAGSTLSNPSGRLRHSSSFLLHWN